MMLMMPEDDDIGRSERIKLAFPQTHFLATSTVLTYLGDIFVYKIDPIDKNLYIFVLYYFLELSFNENMNL